MSGYQLTVMHKSTKWRQDPFKHMKLQASCTAVNFLLWSLMGYLRTFWWSDRSETNKQNFHLPGN